MGIVIFGREPTIPMRLEQRIAEASPANEIRVDSFEDYDDCHKFCKSQQTIGFVIIDENCGELSPSSVLANLCTSFEQATGITGFGLLLHSGDETVKGLKEVRSESRFLDYVDRQSILDLQRTKATLDAAWQSVIDRTENQNIPTALERTLRSIAEANGLSSDDQRFTERLTTILISTLNVSWLDVFSLRWIHVLTCLSIHAPESISRHLQLKSLIGRAEYLPSGDVKSIALSSAPLTQRLSSVIKILCEARHTNMLASILDDIQKSAPARGGAIIKSLIKNKGTILDIDKQENSHSNNLNRAG